MPYRPQFAYPAVPGGCEDQRFHYAYDKSNTPVLASGTLAAGAHTGRIPLPMDQDAPFYLFAIQQQPTGLEIRLEDCYANPLSDSGNSLELTNYEYSVLYSAGALVPLESDPRGIYCPRGGVLNLYLNNPTSAPINMNLVLLTLHGVKRYQGDQCP